LEVNDMLDKFIEWQGIAANVMLVLVSLTVLSAIFGLLAYISEVVHRRKRSISKLRR
jgi:hypothetical protein